MNRELKNMLQAAFEAPEPAGRREFLRRYPPQSISIPQFLRIQTTYIRRWVWVFSILLFLAAVIGSGYLEKNMLWCISSFMPILALTVVTESGRSMVYGMDEMEMTTRFSLKSVLLARMGILGSANLVVIHILMLLVFRGSGMPILQTGAYILWPYLLTTYLGLWVVRKVRGKESIYMCAGIAAFVCLGNVVTQSFPISYRLQPSDWRVGIAVISCIGTLMEGYKMIKQTEEFVWNL